jgi:hypothetical protein
METMYSSKCYQIQIFPQNEDWHDRVTYQTILGTFSFPLVYGKKLSLFPNIYSSSLLLAQFSSRKYSTIESQMVY